jgi:hypothetical protein
VPDETKKESRVKRFSRWMKNERISAEIYFLPYADALLGSLAADRVLLLAIDGSIETFFSDQKSRGFNLHKSHVSDPARLARLLIAACLACI